MNQRFFVAILPPDAIQTEVIQIQNYFRDRYTNNQAKTKSPPHITLIAPFNLSSDRLEPLQIELEKFAKTRSHFAIDLSGFAAFAPRVIYLNVALNPILPSLYSELTSTLAKNTDLIDPYAHRPFVPHMTVSSLSMTDRFFNEAWAEFCDRKILFKFEAIALTLLAHDQQKWNIHGNFSFRE
jgi:2'-5' RNA ligase